MTWKELVNEKADDAFAAIQQRSGPPQRLKEEAVVAA